MKVLIIGNGGREHALAWVLSKNAEIISTPQNPGIASLGTCFNVAVDDLEGLISLAKAQSVDLVVIGPELPLTLGLADKMKENGINVFGPSQKAAQLEGSKMFAKEIMKKYDIPTAEFEVFMEADKAKAYVAEKGMPIVVKADGLAAGKGVLICETLEDANAAIDSMLLESKFGDAGKKIVIEECMVGEEASILALTDGKTIKVLPSSQDHKRVFDNDQGLNTGGMGAYSPAPCVTEELMKDVYNRILEPMVKAMEREGFPYEGVLYAGLMLTEDGPKVVEFNCRFGDPEAQAVLPLLDGDVAEILLSCSQERLGEKELKIKPGSAVCIVAASAGYPGSYPKGREITGLDSLDDNVVAFHAGTKMEDGKILTSGGRVLGITGFAGDLKSAIGITYSGINSVNFEGMHYRKDIGAKGLKRIG